MSIDSTISQIKKDVWAKRQLEAELGSGELEEEILLAPVTSEDIQYVCNNVYPFIQLANADMTRDDLQTIEFKPIFDKKSGWTIFDYGPLISVAAPHYQGKKETKAEAEAGEDGGEAGGAGTIIAQQFNVAEALAGLVAEKGWAAVALISGTAMLQLYFSSLAKEKKIDLVDFQTQDHDVDRLRRRADVVFKEIEKVTPEVTPE